MHIWDLIHGKANIQGQLKKCQREIAQLNGDIGQYKQEAEILRAEAAASRYRIGQLDREVEGLKEEIQKCQT